MNINFNLARPAADISPVRLVITHRGGPEEADAPGMWEWLDRWAPPPRSSISPSPLKPSVNFSSSITFYDSIPYLNNSTKI